MAEWQFTTSNTDVQGRIVWSESNVSVSNNTSVVSVSVQYRRDDSLMSYGTASGTLTINGKTHSLSKYVELTGNTWKEIGSASETITHDTDGSKSITIKWSGGLSGTSVGSQTTSKTVTLTKIARASTPSTDSRLTIGKAFTVKTNRADTSFTHTVKIWWGYAAQNNYHEQSQTKVTDSCSFTCDEAWADYIPNSESGTLGISCETFDSTGKSIGTRQITRPMYAPDSWVPTAGTVSISIVKPFGSYCVQNYSSVTISMTGAAATHGASISGYRFTGLALSTQQTDSSATSGTLTEAGEQTYTVTVIDSRKRESSAKASVTVTAYSPPAIALDAYRTNESGTADSVGSYAVPHVTGSFTALTGNSYTITASYRQSGTDTWTTAQTWSSQTKTPYDLTGRVFEADSTTAWEVQATIKDALGFMATTYQTIAVGIATMDFLAGGQGITLFGTATKTGLWNNKGYNNLRFFCGTKVGNPRGSDSLKILTDDDVNKALGITTSGGNNTFVGVSNGDGVANGTHVQGATHLNGAWYAVLSTKPTTNIRVNYVVIYWDGGTRSV